MHILPYRVQIDRKNYRVYGTGRRYVINYAQLIELGNMSINRRVVTDV